MKQTQSKLLAASMAVVLLAFVAIRVAAQYAVVRVTDVPVFAGTGLQASVTGTNNWTTPGGMGALGGTPVLATYAKLIASQPAALSIRFNQHGPITNSEFFFSMTTDGTNFAYNSPLNVHCPQATDGVQVQGNGTNGSIFFTNFTAAHLNGAVGIRLDRFTNSTAISNIIIQLSQPYNP